jgi:hypothetical protein
MKLLTATLLAVIIFLTSHAQNRYDVVIDEMMIDPTPQIALPNNEWIELRNTSSLPVNIQGWRIGDLTGQSGPMPNFILQPDSMVIICTGSAVAAMSVFGTTISVTSFPSLDNDADQVFLKAANGKIIHAVSYTQDWYQNDIKKDGGWSLEMTDTKNPCSGSDNWKASNSITGGTPGRKNSVDALNADTNAPQLTRAYTTDNQTIILVFDEPVDSLAAAVISNYTPGGGLVISSVSVLAPLFNQVQLKLAAPMQASTVYTITAAGVKDCKGNLISNHNTARVGLPADAAKGELIINEILFNPRPNAFDYIEFYNNSNKIFDASKLFIANRSTAGAIGSIKAFSNTPVYIFPKEYIVLTENAASLTLNYMVRKAENVLTVSPLPSFPDDEGNAVLLNFQGMVIDELAYNKNWHFKLVDNDEGIALERVDPADSTQKEGNWHSAASTAGFGTPTYVNSQYKNIHAAAAAITVTPKVFSPDNDGHDDIMTLQYTVSESGYVANVTIFDVAGLTVKHLVRNGTLSSRIGYWNWTGLDDIERKLPAGTYIIYTENFNLQGKKKQFKNTVVVARRFN